MMYDGSIKSVQDIQSGDCVMGWDSLPHLVTSTTRGTEEMFRISRPHHESYTVNRSHIVSLVITNIGRKRVTGPDGRKYGAFDVCNITVDDYVKHSSKTFRHVAKGFCAPVSFPAREVPVDPYFLGVWLGDGQSNALQITVLDNEIVDFLQSFASENGFTFQKRQNQNSGKAADYFLKDYKHNPIRKYFRENLFRNKHIPELYKVNSEKVRLEILAGLLDTDGYSHESRMFEFCSQYEHMQKDVAYIARTLGFTARCFTRYNKEYERDYFYVLITGAVDKIPCKVKRKQAHPTPNKNNLVHGITVESVGVGEYYGFTLSGNDRMFLLEDCTVVHNTVTFANIPRKGRVLILSHREELVNQPAKYFDCSFGIEQAAHKSHGEEVVSASVQSIVRRLSRFHPDDFDTVIVDECHHASAASYRKIISHFRPRLLLGFSATPNRADGKGLDSIFEQIIFERDIRFGIENGYLSDIFCRRVDIGYDLTNVRTQRGDYAPDELADAMEGTADAIAQTYADMANGATLIFAASVRNAEQIAQKIPGAVAVTGQTKNRAEIINAFSRREIPCLVNCQVFTEGTDIPLIETVIIARPTQSESLYCQMVGRGLRVHPEKERLNLIDCVGVTGKKSLCTAPSLLGIEVEDLPQSSKERLSDVMLFEMPGIVDEESDTPAMWIKNVEIVDLWAKEQNIDTHGVNWFRYPDGSFVCSLPNRKSIKIPCPDKLGQIKTRDGQSMSTQGAFDYAFRWLSEKHESERVIWDLTRAKKWGSQPASEAQLSMIRRRMQDLDVSGLTKMQAGQIITRMKYRG